MSYSDSLYNKKAPQRKRLLNEGWRLFQIKDGKEAVSKAGNPMFVLTIEDSVTHYNEDIYIVRTEGKRWLLKAILEAVGITRSEDGKYTYELSDLIGKEIEGEVIHEDNTWINREGQSITSKQNKIINFRKLVVRPEHIDWKE